MKKIQIFFFLVLLTGFFISIYIYKSSESNMESSLFSVNEKLLTLQQKLDELNDEGDLKLQKVALLNKEILENNGKLDDSFLNGLSSKLIELTNAKKKNSKYLTDPEGRTVDFVISVRFIHCSVKLSVVKINEIFSPKRIIFLSYDKDHCTILRGFATNVHCIWEKDILPKFTPQRFAEMVDAHVKETGDDTLLKPHPRYPSHIGSFKDRGGWFFLQMINIGVGRYVKDLSENYIVWDSDIIPLTKEMKFFNDKGQIVRYTQKNHGKTIGEAYHKSYEALFGRHIIHPNKRKVIEYEDEETWVAHQMVFTRSVVNKFIDEMEKHRKCEKDMWPEEIVKVAMSMPELAIFAFADYDQYASFAYEEEPEKYDVMLGSYSKFHRIYHTHTIGGYKEGTCCVPLRLLEEKKKEGFHYIVNELHKDDVPKCRSMNLYGSYHRDLSIDWKDDENLIDTVTTE